MMSRSESSTPSPSTTYAWIASPSSSSGAPRTAASSMPGTAKSAFSTSIGLTFSPRDLMMSSLRPTK